MPPPDDRVDAIRDILFGEHAREYDRRLDQLEERLQTETDALRREAEARLEEAIDLYRKLLDKDPLREDVHRQVMRCLFRMGDRAGAMRQFEEVGRVLSEELRAGPSTETIRLYEALVADDL